MAETAAAEPARKGGMAGKMLIVSILLLTAAIVSVGALFFLRSGEPAPESAQAKAAETESAKPIYFSLDPPLVVNFSHANRVSYLQIGIDVMLHDPKARDALKQATPALRNNLILLFSDKDYASLSSRKGKQLLRGDVLDTVREVVRKQAKPELAKAVKQVYFTSFVMQ